MVQLLSRFFMAAAAAAAAVIMAAREAARFYLTVNGTLTVEGQISSDGLSQHPLILAEGRVVVFT